MADEPTGERELRAARLWSDITMMQTLLDNVKRNVTELVGPAPEHDTDGDLSIHPLLRGPW